MVLLRWSLVRMNFLVVMLEDIGVRSVVVNDVVIIQPRSFKQNMGHIYWGHIAPHLIIVFSKTNGDLATMCNGHTRCIDPSDGIRFRLLLHGQAKMSYYYAWHHVEATSPSIMILHECLCKCKRYLCVCSLQMEGYGLGCIRQQQG